MFGSRGQEGRASRAEGDGGILSLRTTVILLLAGVPGCGAAAATVSAMPAGAWALVATVGSGAAAFIASARALDNLIARED